MPNAHKTAPRPFKSQQNKQLMASGPMTFMVL